VEESNSSDQWRGASWSSFVHGARACGVWNHWRRLSVETPPFLHPEFFHFTRPIVESPGEPFLVAAVVSNQVVGVLPVLVHGRELRLLRSDHSPRVDFRGDSIALNAVWQALDTDRRWDSLVLDIPADSPLASELPLLARSRGCLVKSSPWCRAPFFALPGFEAALDAKFRTNIRRCGRKAGDLRFERLTKPSSSDFEDALTIEALAWKGQARSSINSDPRLRRFYRSLLRVFCPRGSMSLNFVTVGGRRVASLFTMEDRRTLYALKIGYDPAYAAISPGHLMVAGTAADAERRGLQIFDFIGRENEWKLKWTKLAREHVRVTVQRPSVRGLARTAGRKLVKSDSAKPLVEEIRQAVTASDRGPEPPSAVYFLPTLPRLPALTGACQRLNTIGQHTSVQRAAGRIAQGLGIRSGMRALVMRSARESEQTLGVASCFAKGDWVRVREERAVRQTLDVRLRLRGLQFAPSQWQTCSKVYQVDRVVRRIVDDQGRSRPVSRTVLLAGVHCGAEGGTGGCGRRCPMMYRDDWLEPASPPEGRQGLREAHPFVHVLPLEKILAQLDIFGQKDGLVFMPEMARQAGCRAEVAGELGNVFEHDRWVTPPRPIYLLAGLPCSGAILGSGGPCDRACPTLWHADWLTFERPTS
jgi:CelD/BcsL family acetyltransferase involved in cellulose biosynthesis